MTPQEAINIIEDVTWQDNGRHCGKIVPAREVAISTLEKQIPKKVVKHNGSELYHCPNCDTYFLGSGFKHCTDCGQALDWSGTE